MRIEALENRTLLAGVTLLSHGYLGNITGWVDKVADDITARAGGANSVSQYVMTIDEVSNNPAVISFTRESGFVSPVSSTITEIIIKLDWSAISGGRFSTGEVAQVVTNYFLQTGTDGIRLAELPFHLVGHSRGASLNTALAQQLGRAGIWVDQQTNLDPHPVDGFNDLGGLDFDDQAMATFDNTAFADTYWRTDGDVTNIDFDGEPVANSHNLELTAVQQTNFGSAHNAVPSYYDGTVNLSATNGGDTPISNSWYGTTPDKPPRDQTGFFFARLVGGQRPVDGLWTASSGTAARTAAGQSGSQWGNIGDVRVLGGREFPLGQSISIRFIRQDRDSKGTFELLMDRDTNPYNNNFVRTLRKVNVAETDTITATRQTGATQGADAGRYWVCGRIKDGNGHVRYSYSGWFKMLGPSSGAELSPGSPRQHTFSATPIPRDRLDELA